MGKLLPALILAGCLVLPFSAAAEQSTGQPRPFTLDTARAMDANKDRVISEDEFMKGGGDPARWSELDANNDGVADEDETMSTVVVEPRFIR